jgi:hypothetical protein
MPDAPESNESFVTVLLAPPYHGRRWPEWQYSVVGLRANKRAARLFTKNGWSSVLFIGEVDTKL